MRRAISWLCGLMLILFLGNVTAIPARADNYPGVFTSEDSLVFIQAGDEFGTLQGIVVLSYEYSMDWVIISARLGVKTESGLLITDGHQYVYNADGTRRSEIEFSSAERVIDWEEMRFKALTSDSHFLAPMVRGGLAYALVETKAGLPSQLVLAGEALETGQTINLFDGFMYQLSEGELTAQIAFTEVSFGTQGLVRGNFPEDFPPPPEDYPYPYPEYPTPNYPPPPGYETPPADILPGQPINPSLPVGTEIPPEEQVDRPRFTLEPMHDYDVPPLQRVGIVAVRSTADIEGYAPVCDEIIQNAIGQIEGVEAVYIPWDSNRLGGAVIYDRATWLCEEYGVDALMLSELDELEIPGGIDVAMYGNSLRINAEISSKLIEGVGGSSIWEGEFESKRMHDSYEAEDGAESILKSDLAFLINEMVNDLIDNGVLEGIHVD